MYKILTAFLISILPLMGVRKFLLRKLFGYKISASAKIGFLTVIAVKSFSAADKVRIGNLNFFKGPINVTILEGARIGRLNRFTCARHISDPRFAKSQYTPVLHLGKNTLILDEHFFDVYGTVSLGDGSWIAGHGSEFWTHGLSVTDRNIIIGEGNYIGSAVRFAPGTTLGSNNIVALGSVVLSKLTCDDSLISGFPAKPIRSIKEDKERGKYRFSFDDWEN